MEERIWIECTCDYEGFADMVKFEGMEFNHPTCPNCGELIDDIKYLSKEDFNDKLDNNGKWIKNDKGL